MVHNVLLTIFGLSFLGLIFLIYKKLPQLAVLPETPVVPSLDHSRKVQLINFRFNRLWREKVQSLSGWLRPLALKYRQLFHIVYRKIQEIERRHRGRAVFGEQEKDKVQKFIWSASELVNQGQFDEAEKKLIQVITWDHKNIAAYKGLADLYWQKKHYALAKDTLEHVLKLNPQDAESHWWLGSLAQAQGQMEAAYERFKMALDFTPNNPKYIDSLLETCILLQRKDLAWKTLAKLKEANPENQKLEAFDERIRKL